MKLTSLNATTEVLMEDGSYKKLKDIELNDRIALGCDVLNIKKVDDSDLYLYDNAITQGDQAVFENNKWVLVRNSKKGAPFKEKQKWFLLKLKIIY